MGTFSRALRYTTTTWKVPERPLRPLEWIPFLLRLHLFLHPKAAAQTYVTHLTLTIPVSLAGFSRTSTSSVGYMYPGPQDITHCGTLLELRRMLPLSPILGWPATSSVRAPGFVHSVTTPTKSIYLTPRFALPRRYSHAYTRSNLPLAPQAYCYQAPNHPSRVLQDIMRLNTRRVALLRHHSWPRYRVTEDISIARQHALDWSVCTNRPT